MIEKFLQPDKTYLDEEGCTWDDAESFIVGKIFGFCCCGSPRMTIKYVLGAMDLLNMELDRKYCDSWKKLEKEYFKSEEASEFMWQWLSGKDWEEHGGSIPGWLTEEGKDMRIDLDKIVKGEIK